jgi:GMP synthase-like glutamine amidotransferase
VALIFILRQWLHGQVSGLLVHLDRHRLPYRIIEAYQVKQYPYVSKADAVIVLGGPSSVTRPEPFLVREARFLAEAQRAGIPILAICLGHQLRSRMAHVEVRSGRTVFGVEPIELTAAGRHHWLFKGLPQVPWFYQNHRDHVMGVARSATLLATSATCPVEAVAWDDYSVSTQFHPEILAAEIPHAVARFADKLQGVTIDDVTARIPAHYDPYVTRLFDNFLYRAGVIPRPEAWPLLYSTVAA